jgi:cell division protease FtsH
MVLPGIQSAETQKVSLTYSTFLTDIDAGKVKSVAIGTDGQTSGTLTNGHTFTTVVPVQLAGDQLLTRLEKKKVRVTAEQPSTSPSAGSQMLSRILLPGPMALIFWFWRRLSKGDAAQMTRALGGVGKSKAKAKVFDAERPRTTFVDIAGYEGAKAEIAEVVDFLRRPERYRRAGAMAARGVLMVGPPGTGKTLLARARAVAGETEVPSLSVADPALPRCSSAWAPPVYGTCSPKRASGRPSSSSSTRSTRSAAGGPRREVSSPTTNVAHGSVPYVSWRLRRR